MSGSEVLAGIANAKINGQTYQLEGKAAYTPTRIERSSLTGQDGFHGFKEMPKVGRIKMSLRDRGDLSVSDFNAMRNETIQLELASGKIVTGRNMGQVGDLDVETEDGTFDVTFEGPEVIEQTVS
ncbi:phage tail tube protein [Burkholderia gladioli]|uniref:phage tail tube protein n=1 Tax=Burkholderia gladioli TaxID=28095 RepID=UPI00163F48B4|nr:phage tail tube protein [Burkholderia gladioli]